MKTRFLRNSKLAGGFGLLLALILALSLALPAMAGTPHYNIFRGSVTVCGEDMPEGTVVEAELNGVPENSVTVDDSGQYPNLTVGMASGETGDAVQIIVEGQVVYEGVLGEGVLENTGTFANVDLELDPMLTIAVSGSGTTTPAVGEHGPYTCDDPQALLADPDTGWHFVEWTGDVDTVDNVTAADTFITMDGIYSIMANFEAEAPPDECTLTFDVIGTGSVTDPASSPG